MDERGLTPLLAPLSMAAGPRPHGRASPRRASTFCCGWGQAGALRPHGEISSPLLAPSVIFETRRRMTQLLHLIPPRRVCTHASVAERCPFLAGQAGIGFLPERGAASPHCSSAFNMRKSDLAGMVPAGRGCLPELLTCASIPACEILEGLEEAPLRCRAGARPAPLCSGNLSVLPSLPAELRLVVSARSSGHILGAGAGLLVLAVGMGHGQQKLTPT